MTRGGRTEKRRGGGGKGSGKGSRNSQGASRRWPHSRGKVSKQSASSKKRSAVQSYASERAALREGQRSHSKKAKKTTKPQRQPGARQQSDGAERNAHEDVGLLRGRGREAGESRKVADALKHRKQEMQRGGASVPRTSRVAATCADGAAAAAGLYKNKLQQRDRRGKRRIAAVKPGREDRGSWNSQLSKRKNTVRPLSERPATAAARVAAAEGEPPDGAQDGMSVSKKRKLETQKKLSIRNKDAGYIKQCFRLYGQLLAAPRSAREEVMSAALPTKNGDEVGQGDHTSKDVASGKCSSRRSPAVQKAAAELYNFILPRVKEKDRHLCTSRSIQMLLKHGSKEQRKALWHLLKSEFSDLCMGRNSCQLAMKLYLYGDSACQEEIVQLLKDPKQGKPVFFSKSSSYSSPVSLPDQEAVSLHSQKPEDEVVHSFGARVWEYVYTAAKSEKLQAQMLRAIVLPPLAVARHLEDSESLSIPALFEKFDPDIKKLTLDHLASVIQNCVDKELLDRAPVHKILQWYTMIATPEQLQEVMNVTAEGFLRLASTKSGVEAMTTLSGFATAKQRKTLVKELKKHVVSMAKNAVDCVFVLRLLCTVDDTRLLREGVLQPLLANVKEIIVDPYGQLILLQLLENSAELSRYLPPYYIRLLKLPSPTSLKPMEVRLGELREPVLEAVEGAFMNLATRSAEEPGDDSEREGNDEKNSDEPKRQRQLHPKVLQKPEFTLTDWFLDPRASRILTKFFHQSTSSRAFSVLVAYFLEDLPAALAYLDHPQVQRFLSGLAKQMEPSTTGSSPAGNESTVANSRALKTQAWEVFLLNVWERLLKPHLPSILPTRGVFVVSDVLEAARRLTFKNLEDDIIGSLDSDVLSDARAKLLEQGVNSVGLEILISKLSLKTTKP